MHEDDHAQNHFATELLALMSVPVKKNSKLNRELMIPMHENHDLVVSRLLVGIRKYSYKPT